MELKHVIPNMDRTFGNLEYAGEGKVEQRRQALTIKNPLHSKINNEILS